MIQWLKRTFPSSAPYLRAASMGAALGLVILVLLELQDAMMRHQERTAEQQTQQLTEHQEQAVEQQTEQLTAQLTHVVQQTARQPYFSHSGSELSGTAQQQRILSVSVRNSDVIADNIVCQIIVLDQSLDPNHDPVHRARMTSANPVGPNAILTQRWIVPPEQTVPPAFVVFQVQYTDTSSAKRHTQPFFLKFFGESYAGGQSLFSASQEEKGRIERYLQYRSTPLL